MVSCPYDDRTAPLNTSVTVFKTKLKTYLFKDAFDL